MSDDIQETIPSFGVSYEILTGEPGKELSVAIGYGTFSDNYSKEDVLIPLDSEMELVEVGYTFNSNFSIATYVDDVRLNEMILLVIDGKDPF